MPNLMLSIATTVLAVICFGLVVTLVHRRRRHRAMRSTLHRVACERDAAIWEGRHSK